MNKLFSFIMVSIILSGCGTYSIVSLPDNPPVSVDGFMKDWSGQLKYLEDEKLAVGLKNNENFLFLSVATNDRAKIMQIIRAGFTVWLKPENGKTFGIVFPTQNENIIITPKMGNRNSQPPNLNRLISRAKMLNKEFKIINDNDYSLYEYPISSEVGYKLAIDVIEGRFVYELQVPLNGKNGAPIFLSSHPGETVDVTIETGDLDFEGMEIPERQIGQEGDEGYGGGNYDRRRNRGVMQSGRGNRIKARSKINIDLAIKLQGQ